LAAVEAAVKALVMEITMFLLAALVPLALFTR
jgi:hypothetical protein